MSPLNAASWMGAIGSARAAPGPDQESSKPTVSMDRPAKSSSQTPRNSGAPRIWYAQRGYAPHLPERRQQLATGKTLASTSASLCRPISVRLTALRVR
jgi:hypothetical protein